MNGQAESANKVVLNGLKKRLDDAKGRCADELHAIISASRTTEKSSTGEIPFMLVCGTEAILPIEVTIHTHHLTRN